MSDVTPSSASDIEKSAVHETRIERVDNEAEKHGLNSALRIDGDDEDHYHEPPVRQL